MKYDTTELMLENQKAMMTALSELVFAQEVAANITTTRGQSIRNKLTLQISRTQHNLEERENNRKR